MSVLPEWLGDLTSLQRLEIWGCQRIKSLPQCVQQLTTLKELQIRRHPELKEWCGFFLDEETIV
ncbi:hypothetical protein C2845_PM01G36060 [Panicum miliaceum]|uniref:R13L1/DRL21-like LRR repeat region domain-containing protein n=1 Tax=Panicum miliaceum TaxID=4540 RepID=A0A3L6TJT2_PANMI|nr:hypothetical protein C2845_PM01G36060 [Panicum miliaceum]